MCPPNKVKLGSRQKINGSIRTVANTLPECGLSWRRSASPRDLPPTMKKINYPIESINKLMKVIKKTETLNLDPCVKLGRFSSTSGTGTTIIT